MYLINRISVVLVVLIWFVEDSYELTCYNNLLAGVEVRKCYHTDGMEMDNIYSLPDQLNMTIKFSDEVFNLNLIKSQRNILNDDSILWDISFDAKDEVHLTRHKIYQSIPMLKNAQVYVDEKNSAVLITYRQRPDGVYSFDGIVGRYEFSYADDVGKYFYQKFEASLNEHSELLKIIDQSHFKLLASEKDSIIKILIAADALNTQSGHKFTMIRQPLLHLTTADLIFSKFTSPKVKLSVTGLIMKSDPYSKERNITEIFVKEEDKQFFSGDNFDITFFLTNNPKRNVNDTEPSWSISTIQKFDKPFFSYLPADSSSGGFRINYLKLSTDLTNTIRDRKLLPNFPFTLDVSAVIKNSFNLSNIWSYIPDEDVKIITATTSSITTAKTSIINADNTTPTNLSFSDKIIPTTTSSTTTAKTSTINADNTTPINLPFYDKTTNNNSSFKSEYTVIGGVIAGLLLIALFSMILVTMRKSKFTVWWIRQNHRNSKRVQRISEENCTNEELLI